MYDMSGYQYKTYQNRIIGNYLILNIDRRGCTHQTPLDGMQKNEITLIPVINMYVSYYMVWCQEIVPLCIPLSKKIKIIINEI